MNENVIGVVAGAGPFAGHDLVGKILAQTAAQRDQDHLPIISLYRPADLPDRTAFLLGHITENPAGAIVTQLAALAAAGATVAAIPCNTAHAPRIFDEINAQLKAGGTRLRFLNMIAETLVHLERYYPTIRRVGVLSTTGTYQARIYPDALEPAGLQVIVPDWLYQTKLVQPAIYDPDDGIKATGRVTDRAVAQLRTALAHLRDRGAQAAILGCTELPLAQTGLVEAGLPLIDPTLALARALVAAVDRNRLRPFAVPVFA